MTAHFTVASIDRIEPGTALAADVAQVWMDVANSGGAVGFPLTPVDLSTVQKAVQRLAAELDRGQRIVIGASGGAELVGWVSIRLNDVPLTAHWAKLEHLQSHPLRRSEGIGAALLRHAVEHATALGLEQLILAARGGEQLEAFYERYGWSEIGRHVGALRFADNDDRDEILMRLRLIPA